MRTPQQLGPGGKGFRQRKVMVPICRKEQFAEIGGSMRKDLNKIQGPGRLESEEDIFVFALFFFRKNLFFGGIFVGFTAELLDEDILNLERIQ